MLVKETATLEVKDGGLGNTWGSFPDATLFLRAPASSHGCFTFSSAWLFSQTLLLLLVSSCSYLLYQPAPLHSAHVVFFLKMWLPCNFSLLLASHGFYCTSCVSSFCIPSDWVLSLDSLFSQTKFTRVREPHWPSSFSLG